MTAQPDAFLSYTRIDDEFFGGAITSFRKLLELGVRVVTGNRNFAIFQDIDGIEFGQKWQKRLDEAIVATQFLIPIVTPLFFQSSACRSELEKFVEHERSLGRDDLILPIYFVTTPLLEKADQLKTDLLASEIHTRQRVDWRELADLPIDDPQIRKSVRGVSEKIASAISRSPVQMHERQAQESKFASAIKTIDQRHVREKKAASKCILWVDDRPDNNTWERKAMQAYNIEFVLAKSTEEALTKLRGTHFDAIISDMGRPPDARAGYTLLATLRASGNRTPYFIYAGSNDPKHVAEAFRRGAQGSTNVAAHLIAEILKTIGTQESDAHSPALTR